MCGDGAPTAPSAPLSVCSLFAVCTGADSSLSETGSSDRLSHYCSKLHPRKESIERCLEPIIKAVPSASRHICSSWIPYTVRSPAPASSIGFRAPALQRRSQTPVSCHDCQYRPNQFSYP
ncbi:hypothetical protein P280DRAFT_215895 [Massarina eburnea CBS 473.64]|uniref:Uncharacterized protein n=1 Tax=Massarina eburnea CBS 473.64 TaxID=1395130 RepID=A0A6A6S7L8_9PLEO|nr:hypothetical protein P280DRAFT_215895 [Massarina eburnea CBS 473.64]